MKLFQSLLVVLCCLAMVIFNSSPVNGLKGIKEMKRLQRLGKLGAKLSESPFDIHPVKQRNRAGPKGLRLVRL